jgi:hypothetical protein
MSKKSGKDRQVVFDQWFADDDSCVSDIGIWFLISVLSSLCLWILFDFMWSGSSVAASDADTILLSHKVLISWLLGIVWVVAGEGLFFWFSRRYKGLSWGEAGALKFVSYVCAPVVVFGTFIVSTCVMGLYVLIQFVNWVDFAKFVVRFVGVSVGVIVGIVLLVEVNRRIHAWLRG